MWQRPKCPIQTIGIVRIHMS
ncbi:hypothetical protein F383_00395 [Gossypium arboreum]|uniref:Uncharacterized protein n=1 Tax=Gossypium arboreum TaxID=29729 RepID=A0A0B0NTB4_GOSAR|nr:hypothetical protein F383_00395 [Gossypium arboreum]